MEFKTYAKKYFSNLINIINDIDIEELNKVADVFVDAYKNDRKVYIMGNGGSASTASHYACDFNKGTSCEGKKRFRFVSLNDNIAHFTAIANDISYDYIFSEQLKNILLPEDLVVTISASGNSKNVIKALEYAKSKGSKTVAIVGFSGGKALKIADISLHVKSSEYGPVEDLHMIFDHLISTYFKKLINENSI